MENIEKYIPLLIIVASFIVSIVKNVKKASAGKGASAPAPVPRQGKAKPKKAARPQRPVMQVPKERAKAYSPEDVEPVFSSLPYTPESIEEEEVLLSGTESAKPAITVNLQDADEAQRAFIYSEILARKYE